MSANYSSRKIAGAKQAAPVPPPSLPAATTATATAIGASLLYCIILYLCLIGTASSSPLIFINIYLYLVHAVYICIISM
jgi:hypothetical protein